MNHTLQDILRFIEMHVPPQMERNFPTTNYLRLLESIRSPLIFSADREPQPYYEVTMKRDELCALWKYEANTAGLRCVSRALGKMVESGLVSRAGFNKFGGLRLHVYAPCGMPGSTSAQPTADDERATDLGTDTLTPNVKERADTLTPNVKERADTLTPNVKERTDTLTPNVKERAKAAIGKNECNYLYINGIKYGLGTLGRSRPAAFETDAPYIHINKSTNNQKGEVPDFGFEGARAPKSRHFKAPTRQEFDAYINQQIDRGEWLPDILDPDALWTTITGRAGKDGQWYTQDGQPVTTSWRTYVACIYRAALRGAARRRKGESYYKEQNRLLAEAYDGADEKGRAQARKQAAQASPSHADYTAKHRSPYTSTMTKQDPKAAREGQSIAGPVTEDKAKSLPANEGQNHEPAKAKPELVDLPFIKDPLLAKIQTHTR